jgi:excalibur calcium-binding domain-containing protein
MSERADDRTPHMNHTHRRTGHHAALGGVVSAVVALSLLAGCASGEELRAAPVPMGSAPDSTATVTVTVTAPAPPGTAAPGLSPSQTPAAPQSTPSPAGQAASVPDPRFTTCKKAIAAGYGPYERGIDEEYDWYADSDDDGIVCTR